MSNTKVSSRNLMLLNIALVVVFSVSQGLVLTWLGIAPVDALIDSLVSNVLLGLICYNTTTIFQYYRPGKSKFFYVFIWDLGISGVWLFIINKILSYAITDVTYLTLLVKSLPVRFFIAFLITGWFSMMSWIIYSYEEQSQHEKRKAEADKLAKEAELFKLRKQLHPHFLFNSLNSISALTVSRPEEARSMVQQLADFLRGTLKNEEELQVSLEEELRLLQLYLDIEKVRFGHRLDTVIDCKDVMQNISTVKIPQLLLQPIVENAIKFGLYDTTDNVLIKLTAKKETNLVSISVQNPFDATTSSSQKGTGFGLSSIARRLYLLYGRNDLLETKAEGNTFITTVKIPQND